MIETPHLKWPFKMGIHNKVEFVEQDTAIEIAQCVAFVLSTEPGELVPSPAIGLVDPTFKELGLTNSELVQTIRRWEPRALFSITENSLVNLAQTVGLTVQ